MTNFFLLVKKIIKAKWVFIKPKQKKYLIYDSANSNYLLNYIKKKDSIIYFSRLEEINFFILIYAIINKGFKDLRKNYKFFFLILYNQK